MKTGRKMGLGDGKRVFQALSAFLVLVVAAGQAAGIGIFDGSLDLGRPGDDPNVAGGASFDGTTYTVVGGGSDWWNNGEYGHFLYKEVTGDFRIEADVEVVNDGSLNDWLKAGVAVRNDIDTGFGNEREINFIAAVRDPTKTNPSGAFEWRENTNEKMVSRALALGQPTRVALQRNTINGAAFVEGFLDFGGGWQRVDGRWGVGLNETAYVGLAMAGKDRWTTETGLFSNVQFVTPTSPMNFGRVPGTPVAVGPEGGYGYFGVREVINNGVIDGLDAVVNSLHSGTGTIVVYTAPVINIRDSGPTRAGSFRNDGVFGVVNAGHSPQGSVDRLAMVAHANIVIPTAGQWTFCVNSDDGFELAIDGIPIARESRGKGLSDVFGTADLTAGVHSLQFLYWEGGGLGGVELSAARGVKTVVDNDFRLIGHQKGPDIVMPGIMGDITVTTTTPGDHGRIHNLFEATTALASGPTMTVTDTSINYDDPHDGWTSGSYNRIGGDKPFPNDTIYSDEDFALRAEGTLEVPVDGTYHFGYRGNDGGSLRIVGQTWDRIVADATGRAAITGETMETDTGTGDSYTVGEITLTAGEYDFELLYFSYIADAWVEFFGGSAEAPVYELLMADGAGTFEDFDGLQLVPEPATMGMLVLLALSLPKRGGLAVLRRRRRKQ